MTQEFCDNCLFYKKDFMGKEQTRGQCILKDKLVRGGYACDRFKPEDYDLSKLMEGGAEK